MLEIKYTLGFEDETTQDITIGPFSESQSATIGSIIKANVQQFNDNFTSDTAKLMLSKYGNKWNGISRVRLITTDLTVYF